LGFFPKKIGGEGDAGENRVFKRGELHKGDFFTTGVPEKGGLVGKPRGIFIFGREHGVLENFKG